MKRALFGLILLLLLGCRQHSQSITYNESFCTSISVISGGYANIGFQISARDSETGEPVEIEWQGYTINEGGSGGTYDESYSCFVTDPSYPIKIKAIAKGYLPAEVVLNSLEMEKMHQVELMMEKKPECYFDENLSGALARGIVGDFGLENNSFEVLCMDSEFSRGGYYEAKGTLAGGGEFELLSRQGWCSSGGQDCGYTKCFTAKGNQKLFYVVRENLCSKILSFGNNNTPFCENGYGYDNTTEVRQKCIEGIFDYTNGEKLTISIVQGGGRCESMPLKGPEDCLSIY